MIVDEEKVLEPFFNSAKHWSFEELSRCIELDDEKISSWLKKLEAKNIIVRFKKHGKTFYRYKHEGREYWKIKKEFSRKLIQESGLIKKLMSHKKAKRRRLTANYRALNETFHSVLKKITGSCVRAIRVKMQNIEISFKILACSAYRRAKGLFFWEVFY